ncbi:hypothetical protein BFAG_01051 [Bacteroides fragilis 3_1_12]|uniref:Uncharacterized protein n=1 Tax=Bacteroides fragilis 3_1_12 TaxID=457424 RepID=A0ABN0BHG2_BACFG|nr:hypothetical protein BFAG_01051 [Bacteroides fragilis 3_1_12]
MLDLYQYIKLIKGGFKKQAAQLRYFYHFTNEHLSTTYPLMINRLYLFGI